MSSHDKVCIYRAANAIEAHMVKGLLEGEGIQAQLQGELLGGGVGELPPTDVTVDLLVSCHKEQQAEQVIEQYLAQKKTELPDWYCRHCGEANSGHFEICWQCQKEPNEQQASS